MEKLLPQLLLVLHESDIVPLQLLQGGKVREVLSSQTYFEDILVPVTPADCIAKTIFVRDLPFEMSNESVEPVFSTVKSVYHKRVSCHLHWSLYCLYACKRSSSVHCQCPWFWLLCVVSWDAYHLHRKNRKLRVENQMVRSMLFRIFSRKWAVIWDDPLFPLWEPTISTSLSFQDFSRKTKENGGEQRKQGWVRKVVNNIFKSQYYWELFWLPFNFKYW